jgi:hypothetical protein
MKPNAGAVFRTLAVATYLALGVGCESQASKEYPGEPLLTLSGAVVTGTAQATGNAPPKAAVLWYGFRALVGASASVRGQFPSQFTLSLYSPPPEEVRNPLLPPVTQQYNLTLDRGPLTLGWIVALAPDTNEADVKPEDVLGYSLDMMVAYLDRDANPADPMDEVARYATLWQIPPTRGYHLVKLQRSDRTAYDQCMWNGLCVAHTSQPRFGIQAFVMDALNSDYLACLAALPTAPHCTLYHRTTTEDPEPAENAACFELQKQYPRRTDCQVPLQHVPNPQGFAAPVTITMGVTFREVFM